MTVSAAQASAFYAEVIETEMVWALRDSEGFPAPLSGDGQRSMPFWSKRSRAELVVSRVPAYTNFDVVSIPLLDWRTRWLPGLERDGLLVGLNWSGSAATGFDVEPSRVQRNLDGLGGKADP